MFTAEVAARDQQQETAASEGVEKNDETRRNAEAAESEDIEEEMDRRAASLVPTLSRRHRSKI
eukprot:6467669-Prymnesium_polylepis.1